MRAFFKYLISTMLIFSLPAHAGPNLIDAEDLHHAALILKGVDLDRLLERERTGDWNQRHDLGTLSAMLQDLVTDLERGGAQTADFLERHPEGAHDLRIVLRALFKDEAYRKITPELDLGEHRQNLFSLNFPEPLASLSNPIRDEIIANLAQRARQLGLGTLVGGVLFGMIPPAGVAEFATNVSENPQGIWTLALTATSAILLGACVLILTGDSEKNLRSSTRFKP